MEKFKKLQFCNYLVFILLNALCLTSLDRKVFIDATRTKGTTIWRHNTYINSSGFIYTKNGTSLQLNCSVYNQSLINIGWKNNDKWLTDVVEYKQVVQLKIDRVTWELNASNYWCGPKNKNAINYSLGAKATIIVGDLPSPPRNVNPSFKIYGLVAFEIHVYWESAKYVGELSTNYIVSYKPCYNDSFCGDAPEYEFCKVPHILGKVQYHCQRSRDDIMSAIFDGVSIRDLFYVTIATVNALGESKAPGFWIDADYGGDQSPFLPTPLPPKSFKAKAESQQIELSWKQRTPTWGIYDTKYTILYHSISDQRNKTKVVQNKEGVTIKEGIKPYTWYYIYMTVELMSNNSWSGRSDVLRLVVQTDESTPHQGPRIVKAISKEYGVDLEMRNVTVQWEEINESSWQGKPSQIKVYFSKLDNQSFSLVKKLQMMQSIPSNVTVSGLSSSKIYNSHVKLCNTKICGTMGPLKTIEESVINNGPENQDKKTKNDFILGLVIFIIGAFFVFIIVVAYKRYLSSRKRIISSQSSQERQFDDMTVYQDVGYHDVENIQPVNDYHFAGIIPEYHAERPNNITYN